MSRRIRSILIALNKGLSVANAFMIGVGTFRAMDLKKAQHSNVPLFLNLLFFLWLVFACFVLTYGAYRQSM